MDEFLFLYIERFIYHNKSIAKKYFGHPKTGRIYRAYKHEKTYRIPLASRDGSLGLVLEDGLEFNENSAWNYKLQEITLFNIDEFNLPIEQLQQIEREYMDEESTYEENNSEEEREDQEDTNEVEDGDQELFINLTNDLNDIAGKDYIMLVAIGEVVRELRNTLFQEENELKKFIANKIIELKQIKENGINNN